jgi:hypothetical protein
MNWVVKMNRQRGDESLRQETNETTTNQTLILVGRMAQNVEQEYANSS